MNQEQEAKVLASLYDRLYDAVIYSPSGKAASFNDKDTYFQMVKNVVINPDDFANMMSPANPKGQQKAAQMFSGLVDALPTPGLLWSDSGKKVSDVLKTILGNANTNAAVNENQKKIYEKAYKFLNTETEITDFNDNKTMRTDPSPRVLAYQTAQAAYISAVGGYRTAFNGYDLDLIEDQRAWNAVEPGLNLNVNQTWDAWIRSGKGEVEPAQNALMSTINDAVSYAIAEAQRLASDAHHLPSLTPGGVPWLPSYALPSNWSDQKSTASKLTFKSSYLNKSESSSAHAYATEASARWGLWHGSAKVKGEIENTKAHMDAEDFTLEAELITVTIKRPWFNPLLFGMNNWWVKGYGIGGISSGSPTDPKGAMPLLPTGFVVARNVKISAAFTEEDKKTMENLLSTEGSVGWGPFSISGEYKNRSSERDFKSTFDGGTLHLPGLQIIAWISTMMPKSPTQNAPE